MMLAMIVGLHRVMIGSLVWSFRVIPAGSASHPELSFPYLFNLTVTVIETGVSLSLPILAVLFMVQLALGFVSRAAPSMQIFSIGFAVTLAVGASVLVMAAPDLARGLVESFSRAGYHFERLLHEVSP